MDALPFRQQFVLAIQNLGDQAPHVGPLDADAEQNHQTAIPTRKLDFCLTRAGDVDMCRSWSCR
jgi:hypothetical protein